MVKLYDQGNLASEAVGTPGVDRSAGAAYRGLAQGAGQLAQEQMQTQGIAASIGLTALGAVGNTLATGIKQFMIAKQQQKEYLENIDVTEAKHEVARFANDQRRQLQEKYIDNPEQAEDELRDRLGEFAAQQGEQFNTARGQAKYRQAVEPVVTSETDQIGNWSFTQRTKNAVQRSENNVNREVQGVVEATGSLESKYSGFLRSQERLDALVQEYAPVLGTQHAEALAAKGKQQSGRALFENFMSSPPDNLDARLTYVKDVRRMLNDHVTLNVTLDSNDKRQIDSMLDAQENKYTKDLQDHLFVKEFEHEFNTAQYRATIDADWQNMPLQERAIQDATAELDEIKKQAAIVAKNPDYPESLKNAYAKTYATEAGHMDSLIKAARANIRSDKAEKKADAREARAAANRANSAQEKLAKAQLKAEARKAQIGIGALAEEAWRLSRDPSKMTELRQAGADLYASAKEGLANETLTPAQANRASMKALALMDAANKIQQVQPNPIAALFGAQPTYKKVGDAKSVDQRTKAVADMQALADEMLSEQTHDERNAETDMTVVQQTEYDRVATMLRSAAKQQGWTAQVLSQQLNALRNRVLLGAQK